MKDLRQQFIESRIKELQDSTDFVNSLLKSITGYAIIVGDFDGNIVVFNEGARHIFGYDPKDVVGIKSVEDFYPVSFVKDGNLNRLFDRLIKEGGCFYELERQKRDGQTFPGQSLLTLVKDNEERLVGFVEISEDITERKQVQAQMEKANQRLIELDKLKDSFLSTASHEMRTPLTSIKCFTEILLEYDEDREKQKEFLKIIDSETDRLIRLINDFLDISKIQAGRVQWQSAELSLNEIVELAVNSNEPLVKQAGLEVITVLAPELPRVLGDHDRLLQVVTNLLGNSIKFTPEKGKIVVQSWFEKEKGETGNQAKVIVCVRDNGIGIAPKDHQLIFENFGQVANDLKGKPKGTGLGLPICKTIIEHFGGNIWVESELGKGSAFFFSLPALTAAMTKTADGDSTNRQSGIHAAVS